MFVIQNLDFTIDNFNLKINELKLSEKKINAIMGPSGSGKTTLFQILIGIYQPKNWSWNLNHIEMHKLNIDERQLGVVFQHNELFPHLTAAENIQLIMKSRNANSKQDQAQLEKYKENLKLDQCWLTRAENLSGGEAQRVSLLRAVMSKPRLLLLDEPFSALDSELKAEARKVTAEVIRNLNIPTLLITHDLEDAKSLDAQIIRIQQGRLIQD
jgi:ABC-type Fe3+/spermidine/putrescine transport system ATPase subunit